MIHPDVQHLMEEIMIEKMEAIGCVSLGISCLSDHIHLLVDMNPSIAINHLFHRIFTSSARKINTHRLTPEKFSWDEDFHLISVGSEEVPAIQEYIKEQHELHAQISYADEHFALKRGILVPGIELQN